ncbi:MAG: energy-coupling factor transporter transmembrane component T [Thermoleophilia bacterium]
MNGLDAPLGRYLPVESPIHARDARLKLVSSLAYVIALFAVEGWAGISLLAVGLVLVAALARTSPRLLWRGLRPLVFLIVLTVAFQALGRAGEPLIGVGPLTVTRQGLETGLFLGSRLILLLVASAVLTFSTPAVSLTDAVEWTLRPLKVLRLDSHELALMMTIALRFIPTLLEELDNLIKAQRARGVELSGRSPGRLIRALAPLAVPLFVIGFRHADDLAVAMASRCYRGGRGRTRYRRMTFGAADSFGALLVGAWLAAAVLWGRI